MKSANNFLSAALPLAALATALALFSASAGSPSPQPKTVVVSNQSSRDYPLQRAMALWSEQTGTHWKTAKTGEAPDLVITDAGANRMNKICGEECVGWSSTIGNQVGPTTIFISSKVFAVSATALLVHELGHFFGLGHSNGCSVMRAKASSSPYCPITTDNKVQCLFSNEERQTLRELYPGAEPKRSLRCFSF